VDTYASIDALRIKSWLRDPPNPHPHIVIVCGDPECDEVGFFFKEKK